MPHPADRIDPYPIKGIVIDCRNQVWCIDVTDIPERHDFPSLVAILDWAPCRDLAWWLSNRMDARFCVDAVNQALTEYGEPEIFRRGRERRVRGRAKARAAHRTARGSQVIGFDFTSVLENADVRILMDGRRRGMHNILNERLWRPLEYQAVYIHEPSDGFLAECVIGPWIGFNNTEQRQFALGNRTRAEAYRAGWSLDMIDKARVLPTSPQAQQRQQEDECE